MRYTNIKVCLVQYVINHEVLCYDKNHMIELEEEATINKHNCEKRLNYYTVLEWVLQ